MKPVRAKWWPALLLAAGPLAGQVESEFAELLRSTEARIAAGMEDYRILLDTMAGEKLELVGQIDRLENELVRLRREERGAGDLARELQRELEERQARIRQLDTQAQYTAGVLAEYLANFESRLQVAEDQAYVGKLNGLRAELEQAEEPPEDRIPLLLQALETGLGRQEELVGGQVLAGRAITAEGGVKRGTVLLVGPAAYFRAEDGTAAGLLTYNPGTIEPGLRTPVAEVGTMVADFLVAGTGTLPLDASLGKALELKAARGTLVEHVEKGGWVGYLILALGALALLLGVVKGLDLLACRSGDPGDLAALARLAVAGSREEARARARQARGPLAGLLETGVDYAGADPEVLLEAMDSVILRHRPRLERFLPFLATTAAVAPLLGLLGTVTGMIRTFTLIEVFGTGDAKALSSGISEALVTTELGLIVAIPALVLHGWFMRVLRTRVGVLEEVAADFSREVAVAKGTAPGVQPEPRADTA